MRFQIIFVFYLLLIFCSQDILKSSTILPSILVISDPKSALSAINIVKYNDDSLKSITICRVYGPLEATCLFYSVPSHCGIRGNEIVDAPARSDSFTNVRVCMTLSPHYVKTTIQNHNLILIDLGKLCWTMLSLLNLYPSNRKSENGNLQCASQDGTCSSQNWYLVCTCGDP